MSFKRKDLLGLAALSSEEIALILEAAEPFKEGERTRDQKSSGSSRKNRGEFVFRAQHTDPNLVRVGCKTAERRRGEFFTFLE